LTALRKSHHHAPQQLDTLEWRPERQRAPQRSVGLPNAEAALVATLPDCHCDWEQPQHW
jgi:hypothetical protein